jgi:hypothetical protein
MAFSSVLSEPAYSEMNTPRRFFLGLDRKLPEVPLAAALAAAG